MGTISRHSNAPFLDAEVLTGTDLEADFNTLYSEFNASIANANVDAAANISGSKIADNTITDSKLSASTITLASMASSTVPKHYTDAISSSVLEKLQLTLADFTGLTAAVLTPGSANDMIFTCVDLTYSASANPSESAEITIGWHVDGTEFDNVIIGTVPSNGVGEPIIHSSYTILATGTTPITIKPMYKYLGNKTITASIRFRCFILPGKA